MPPLGPLCEQQFWLFGYDIRRSAGNLLIERGFERLRQGSGRPTRYLRESDDETIALWGFGMLWLPGAPAPATFLGRDGGVLESDVAGVPKVREAWRAKRQLRLRVGTDPSLVTDAFLWISRYESWVVDFAGLAHRRRALAETAGCCEAELIAAAWAEHASRLRPRSVACFNQA